MTTMPNTVTCNDFCIGGLWTPIPSGRETKTEYIYDDIGDREYLNEPTGVIRVKCAALTLATPFLHPLASTVNVAYRVLKIVTLAHFWAPKEDEIEYDFVARLDDVGADLARIAATPFAIIGLTFAAIYGIFDPYDGRKLYASLERMMYGNVFSNIINYLDEDDFSYLVGTELEGKRANAIALAQAHVVHGYVLASDFQPRCSEKSAPVDGEPVEDADDEFTPFAHMRSGPLEGDELIDELTSSLFCCLFPFFLER